MLGIYMTFALMYLIFYICGYPLKVFFLRDDLRKFDLYITPWFGIGLVICALYPLSWLGFSVQSVALYFFLAVLLACAASWLRYRERVHFTRNDVIFLVSLALIAGGVYGFKLAQDPNLYAFGVNADYASYLAYARAVLVSSAKHIASLPEGVPYIESIDWTLNFEVRGCVFVQAFVAALLDMELASLVYYLSIFVLFLSVAAFRLFFRNFQYMSTAIPIGIFLMVNNFYGRFLYMSFVGQLFSTGFVTVAFFLEYYLMRCGKFNPAACMALVFVLTSCGMSYVNGLPIPLIPVLALPIVLLFDKRLDRLSCVKNIAFTGILFAIINSWLVLAFIKSFITRNNMGGGFKMNMPTFMDIAGLQGAAASTGYFFEIFLIANALIMFILIRQLRRERLASFFSVSFILFLIVHLSVCVRYFDHGKLSSYYAFKSALSISFMVYILLLRFFEERLDTLRLVGRKLFDHPYGKLAAPIVSLMLIAAAIVFNIKSHQHYMARFDARADNSITKSMGAMKILASDNEFTNSDFIINMELPIEMLAAEYFAPFGRSYTAGYGGFPSKQRRVMKESFSPGDVYAALAVFERTFNTVHAPSLFVNDVLAAYKLDEKSVIQYDYEGLSHSFEDLSYDGGMRERMAKRINDNKIQIIYQTLDDATIDIAMVFQYMGKSPAPRALAYVGGECVGESVEKYGNQFEISMSDVKLQRGLTSITVDLADTDGEPADIFLVELKMGR